MMANIPQNNDNIQITPTRQEDDENGEHEMEMCYSR